MSCASNLINQFLRGQWAHTKKRQPAGETQKQNHKTLDLEGWRLKIFGTRRQLVWTYKMQGDGGDLHREQAKDLVVPTFPRPNDQMKSLPKKSLSIVYPTIPAWHRGSRYCLVYLYVFKETWPSLASFFDQILCLHACLLLYCTILINLLF